MVAEHCVQTVILNHSDVNPTPSERTTKVRNLLLGERTQQIFDSKCLRVGDSVETYTKLSVGMLNSLTHPPAGSFFLHLYINHTTYPRQSFCSHINYPDHQTAASLLVIVLQFTVSPVAALRAAFADQLWRLYRILYRQSQPLNV